MTVRRKAAKVTVKVEYAKNEKKESNKNFIDILERKCEQAYGKKAKRERTQKTQKRKKCKVGR